MSSNCGAASKYIGCLQQLIEQFPRRSMVVLQNDFGHALFAELNSVAILEFVKAIGQENDQIAGHQLHGLDAVTGRLSLDAQRQHGRIEPFKPMVMRVEMQQRPLSGGVIIDDMG